MFYDVMDDFAGTFTGNAAFFHVTGVGNERPFIFIRSNHVLCVALMTSGLVADQVICHDDGCLDASVVGQSQKVIQLRQKFHGTVIGQGTGIFIHEADQRPIGVGSNHIGKEFVSQDGKGFVELRVGFEVSGGYVP